MTYSDVSSQEKTENSKLYLPRHCIVPGEALLDKTLTDGAKIYLGELNVLANKYGYCTASDEDLAEMKGESLRTIQRWNKELEDRGFIKRDTWREHIKEPGKRGLIIKTRRKIYICV